MVFINTSIDTLLSAGYCKITFDMAEPGVCGVPEKHDTTHQVSCDTNTNTTSLFCQHLNCHKYQTPLLLLHCQNTLQYQ